MLKKMTDRKILEEILIRVREIKTCHDLASGPCTGITCACKCHPKATLLLEVICAHPDCINSEGNYICIGCGCLWKYRVSETRIIGYVKEKEK